MGGGEGLDCQINIFASWGTLQPPPQKKKTKQNKTKQNKQTNKAKNNNNNKETKQEREKNNQSIKTNSYPKCKVARLKEIIHH